MQFERISDKKQKELLEKKLEERLKYSLLANPNHKNYKENAVILYDLCKDDWKFFVNNFLWLQDPEAKKADDDDVIDAEVE